MSLNLSPEAQRRLDAATPGQVVYVGRNEHGPVESLHRKYSGKYAVANKSIKKTQHLNTDPQVGQLPNLSRRKSVKEPNYATANNVFGNNNNNSGKHLTRRGAVRTRTRAKPTGGARKKTRKHKKQSRTKSKSRKLRK